MNKKIIIGAAALTVVAATVASTESAAAFGPGRGGRVDIPEEQRLIPTEMRQELRADRENLSDEERAALREQRLTMRQEKQQAFEDFTGLTREEVKQQKQDGASMGDILTQQGISQEQAEIFLNQKAETKIENVAQRQDLTDEQVQTLESRISSFVQGVMDRWFN